MNVYSFLQSTAVKTAVIKTYLYGTSEMMSTVVERVNVERDEHWETSFVTWLEDKERRNIGVENGVFVVSVITYISACS